MGLGWGALVVRTQAKHFNYLPTGLFSRRPPPPLSHLPIWYGRDEATLLASINHSIGQGWIFSSLKNYNYVVTCRQPQSFPFIRRSRSMMQDNFFNQKLK